MVIHLKWICWSVGAGKFPAGVFYLFLLVYGSSGGDTMSFDIPTPFDDWEEPAYAFVNINGARLFLAQDENAAVWADATDAEAEEMIVAELIYA